MGNMREISIEECRAVFGGTELAEPEIVVTGAKKFDASIYLNSNGGYGTGFGFTGYGGGTGNLLNLPLPAGWDLGMVDTDNDGVPDSPQIIVTAAGTSVEANLADTIASRTANNTIIVLGFLTGAMGWELATALRAIGLSEAVTGGIIGTLTVSGVSTSAPDMIAGTRTQLYDVLYDETLNDIHNNPDKYKHWMQNPLNGEFFDATSPPFTQLD